MMRFKKIMSVILAALMLIVPINFTELKASAQDYSGTNVNRHNYYYNEKYPRLYWANPVKSYLTATSGGFMRVQADAVDNCVVVQYYDSEFNLISEKQVNYGLPLFGAFYETEDNYFLLSGQENEAEDDTVEVYRVTKYDKSWNKLGEVGLFGANTTIPFYGGTARMAHNGKFLVVRTCHNMYKSGTDGKSHQANVTFEINTSTMKVTDKVVDVRSPNYGYVSHSFNQFVQIDGNNLVGVDHGDSYPRSVVLLKYKTDMSYGWFYENIGANYCSAIEMLPISGAQAVNETGVEVGGFEISDSSYIVVGNTIDQSKYGADNLPRNIFISTVDRDLTTEPKITYLTDYTDATASNPHLVKLSGSRFLIMWEHNGTIIYRELDAAGTPVSEEKQLTGQLSDCKPVVSGDKVIWYVWNNSSVKFYDLASSDIAQMTGLNATADKTSVQLSWDKVDAAAYYKVFMNKDGEYTELTQTSNNTTLNYTVQNLSNGAGYSFRVCAYNSSGQLLASGSITAKTTNNIQGLTVTPNKASIKLEWDKSYPAASYKIFLEKNGTYEELTEITAVTTTDSYFVKNLTGDTAYNIRMSAYDSSGNVIATDDISARTIAEISGLSGTMTKTTAQLKWNKNNSAAYYKVLVKNGSSYEEKGKTNSGSVLTYTISDLNVGYIYTFRVEAYDAYDNVIAYTDIEKCTVGNISNLVITPAVTSASLTWDKYAAATYFKVFVEKNGSYEEVVRTSSSSVRNCTVDSLSENTIYKFKVAGYNADDEEVAVAEATTTTSAAESIKNLKSTPTPTTVKLTWSQNTSASYYKVFVVRNGTYEQLTQTANNSTVTYTATGLTSNTSYTFRVTAYNLSNEEIATSDISTTTLTVGKIENLSGTVTSYTANLTWTQNASASYYKIFLLNDGTYNELHTTTTNTELAYNATALTPNTGYTFRVTAYNSSNEEIATSDVSVTTISLAKIDKLEAAPTTSTVILTWSKNGSADYYKVFAVKSDNAEELYRSVNNGVVSYTATGLTSNTSYTYRVTAYNANNEEIATSDITTTTQSVGNIENLAATTTISTATLTWNRNDTAAFYKVFAVKNGNYEELTKTDNNTTVTYTVKGLTSNTSYTYRVTAYNSNNEEIATGDVTAKTASVGNIENLAATTTISTATLTWNKNDTAAYYKVFAVKNGTYEELTKTDNNTTATYTVKGLTSNTSYTYRVTAYNANNEEIATSDITTTTQSVGNIENLAATTTISTATLTWNRNDTAAYYKVFAVKNGNYEELTKTDNNTTVTYTVKGLTSNTSCTYRVTAYNSNNEEIATGDVTAKTASVGNIENLAATTTISTATLTWNKNDTAAYYKVFAVKNGNYEELTKTDNNTTVTYTVKGLTSNTSCTYRVTAYNSNNEEIATGDVTAKTASIGNIANLKATPAKTTIKLTWSKFASASYYKVFENKDGTLTELKKVTDAAYTATGLTENTSYKYTVKAYDSSDNEIANGDITAKTYGVISNLKATRTNSSVTLTWSKSSSASYYRVYEYKDGKYTKIAQTTGNTYTAKSLKANTSYKYRVYAYDTNGKYFAYSDITAKTYGVISNLKATRTNSSVTLTWSKSSSASYYRVYEYKDGKYTKIAQTTGNTYTAKSLKANTSYKYRVYAYDTNGKYFAYSDITAKTYGVISNLKATRTNSSVTLTWSKSSSASYYRVYEYKDGKYTKNAQTTGNTYTAKSLKANTSYKYRVYAYDKNGKYFAYSDISAKTYGVISNLKATRTNATVKLSWSKSSSASYYKVYKNVNGSLKAVSKVTGTSYTDKSLKANTTYKYRVYAYDKSGKYFAYSDITAKTLK